MAGWHSSKISKIEHGKQTPSIQDIQAWCKHCGVVDHASDLIATLHVVEGMFVDWPRLERTGLRRAQEIATPLFESARHFRAYDSWLVPGLLQTGPYTTALLEAVAARRDIHEDITAAVAVRMQRQRVLYEGGRQFAILIEESVLRSRIGGTDTMIGQLAHLLSVGSLPSTSLGIIPMTADRDLRPVEGFWIFDNDRVNVELVSGWLTLTRPREVTMYADVSTRLSELGGVRCEGPRADHSGYRCAGQSLVDHALATPVSRSRGSCVANSISSFHPGAEVSASFRHPT